MVLIGQWGLKGDNAEKKTKTEKKAKAEKPAAEAPAVFVNKTPKGEKKGIFNVSLIV